MRLVNVLREFLLLVFLARSLSFLADWCSSRFATTQLLPIPSLNPVKIVETFQIIYAQRAGYLLGAVPFGQLALRWDDNKPFLTTPLWKNIFEMGFSFHWRFASFFRGAFSFHSFASAATSAANPGLSSGKWSSGAQIIFNPSTGTSPAKLLAVAR